MPAWVTGARGVGPVTMAPSMSFMQPDPRGIAFTHVPTHSAWNWRTGQYDYYHSPRAYGYGDTVNHRRAAGMGGLGESPEDSAHNLPLGARRVGSGHQAMGMVVTSGMLGDLSLWALLAACAIGAYYLWRVK
jgi:hypothetical protein